MTTLHNPGFTYFLELVRDGQVIEREEIHNLMPTEGINHMLGVLLKGQSQVAQWYIGLFEGNYTPSAADTAAGLPAAATETSTYAEAARPAFTPGAITGGAVDNTAAKAEFTSNSNKTIYGAFISSASAKGATSGVLLSVAKFSSSKTFNSGDVLRVTAGFSTSST